MREIISRMNNILDNKGYFNKPSLPILGKRRLFNFIPDSLIPKNKFKRVFYKRLSPNNEVIRFPI
jgi:hypothetical protein